MNRCIIVGLATSLLAACASDSPLKPRDPMTTFKSYDSPLLVVLGDRDDGNDTSTSGCPLRVVSLDQSCEGNPPVSVDKACRKADKWVYWVLLPNDSDYKISAIDEKNDSPGFQNHPPCQWNNGQREYKCKLDRDLEVHTEIEYLVTVEKTADSSTCTLDPVIIIYD